MSLSLRDRLIIALDYDDLEEVKARVNELLPWVSCFKIGLELMTRWGAPQVVEAIHQLGGQVFLDGKFHDIPNTVAAASRSASHLGVRYFDVHASSGFEGMRAAVVNRGKSQVFAVTVLTSHDDSSCRSIFGAEVEEKVLQMAREAQAAQVDGLVCSPQELRALQASESLKGLLKMTPGVRPKWAETQDQKRVLTPGEAVAAGASLLVVGRPVTRPPNTIQSSAQAVQMILEEMSSQF